jgi:hypothetical protein
VGTRRYAAPASWASRIGHYEKLIRRAQEGHEPGIEVVDHRLRVRTMAWGQSLAGRLTLLGRPARIDACGCFGAAAAGGSTYETWPRPQDDVQDGRRDRQTSDGLLRRALRSALSTSLVGCTERPEFAVRKGAGRGEIDIAVALQIVRSGAGRPMRPAPRGSPLRQGASGRGLVWPVSIIVRTPATSVALRARLAAGGLGFGGARRSPGGLA